MAQKLIILYVLDVCVCVRVRGGVEGRGDGSSLQSWLAPYQLRAMSQNLVR